MGALAALNALSDGCHARSSVLVKDTLDPMIRANYKNKAGAAVGYLTGDGSQINYRT